jgi:alanyl-tRNA synthetase
MSWEPLKMEWVVFAIEEGEKVQIMVAIQESLTKTTALHAGNMVKTLSALVEGGGGGQAFFATAGGKNKEGIGAALAEAEKADSAIGSGKKNKFAYFALKCRYNC